MPKSKEDLKQKETAIRKACLITDRAFLHVLGIVRVGMAEKDLAKEIDKFIKKNGASLSFPTIVASGGHSFFIHHKPCRRKIKEGEPVLLDFGARFKGYCADLSRTIFIGKAPSSFKKIYKIVLWSQEKAIRKVKRSSIAGEIDKTARMNIVKAGFGGKFTHSTGHGLGKLVHEKPSISPGSKDKLEVGDIITVEPGVYIRGKGGVRIEDDVLIKGNGMEILTKSSKKLKDIILPR